MYFYSEPSFTMRATDNKTEIFNVYMVKFIHGVMPSPRSSNVVQLQYFSAIR